jgi:hypothetical protein
MTNPPTDSLKALAETLGTCRNGGPHYCPNCDNSIGPDDFMKALSRVREETPEWVMPALIAHVRELGCKCEKPLLGYSLGHGPRCRLCLVDAEDEPRRMKERITQLEGALRSNIELFEAWRDGIFAQVGIQWVEEPPAIRAVRALLTSEGGKGE